MWGITAWHRWWGPRAWVRTTRSSSAGSVSTTLPPRLASPALLTRMAMLPKASTTSSTRRRSSSRESTDPCTATARRPIASISATVSSAAWRSRR